MEDFCHRLPKVELHAHLNGSVSQATLKKLISAQRQDGVKSPDNGVKSLDCFTLEGTPLDERAYSQAFDVFKLLHTLVGDLAAVRTITEDVIREFREDNVFYLELRSTPKSLSGTTKRDYIKTIVEVIHSMAGELPDMTVKFLVSIDRARGLADATENLELAIDFHQRYPDAVVGVDFSGDPSRGRATDFVPLLATAKRNGLFISVHVGETMNAEDNGVLLTAGADRLGHAYHIQPAQGGSADLLDAVVKSRTPIEICLSSNVQAGLAPSYDAHPFRAWRTLGHPVVLCTDDKGLFNTSLPAEYLAASKAFVMSEKELFGLSESSIEYIACGEEVKARLRNLWKEKRGLLLAS